MKKSYFIFRLAGTDFFVLPNALKVLGGYEFNSSGDGEIAGR